jgi:GNAT superfamily N-acetyltransferase
VGITVFHFYQLAGCSGCYVKYVKFLYVSEKNHKKRIGVALLQELCRIAKEKHCLKIEWKCISSNTLAKEFYYLMNPTESEIMDLFTLNELHFL